MSLFDDDYHYDDDASSDDDDDHAQLANDQLKDANAMPFCVGHESQERLFLDLYNKDAMPHALIFSGLEGIGKTTMAFRLARFLLKTGKKDRTQDSLFGGDDVAGEAISLFVDENDPVFARIRSGGHADLLHIARHFDTTKGKLDKALKVEALRKIEPFLRRTSSEGGWRIVIIEDADTMNRNAQNAILKILEEPPSNVLIMLIAHRPGRLIPTILSRARVIPFETLSSQNMQDLLARQNIHLGPNDMQALTDLSEGSIGHALQYAEEGGVDMLRQILEYFETSNIDWVKIHGLSGTLSSTAQDKEYRMFAMLLQWIFKRFVFMRARGMDDLPAYLNRDGLRNIFENYPLNKLIEISDNLQNHFERVDFSSLDRRDAVRGAFLVINE